MSEHKSQPQDPPVDPVAGPTAESMADDAQPAAEQPAAADRTAVPASPPKSPDHGRVAATSPPRPHRMGALALLLALLALALAAWPYLSPYTESSVQPAGESELAARLEQLDSTVAGLAEQQGRLTELRAQTQAGLDALDGLGERLQAGLESRLAASQDALLARAERSEARLDALDQSVDELASRLQQAVDSLAERGDLERQAERQLQAQVAMLEAAALLGLGQHRAELAADLDGAQAAFRRAAARLASIDDARLDRVRQVLARELEALQALRAPDLSQTLARLERLAGDSRQWPSQLGEEVAAAPAEQAAVDGEAPAWRERLSGVARGLVRVQARDELGRTSEQFEAARELMQLRLVAAQLALVRQDHASLRLQLGAAQALLDEWFDGTAEPVRQARAELQELAEQDLALSLPQLGEALNLLRNRLAES